MSLKTFDELSPQKLLNNKIFFEVLITINYLLRKILFMEHWPHAPPPPPPPPQLRAWLILISADNSHPRKFIL